MLKPTEEYNTLQQAYDYFNAQLFNNKLPNCLLTFQNKGKNNLGFFHANKFFGRNEKNTAHELALNPENFLERTDKEILSTLVHEMTHVYQQTYGTPSRNGYHNKEWGLIMKDVGLYPSNTGQLGGKETGQQMSHYIILDGKFDKAFSILEDNGFKLSWQSFSFEEKEKGKDKKTQTSKQKYSCSGCGQNAWAKPDSNLICGNCLEPMMEVL